MNQDLDALPLIRDLTSDDFERFKTALNILTSRTFIIRGVDKERELYDFTIRNIALFETWFSCMDAVLVRDESLGVIAFRGSGNTRLRFSKDEICAVLVLRLLYEDKKLTVSLTKFPVASVRDFQDKYNAMTGEEIKKTALIKILARLSSCKLISIESQDYSDPEALIQLYPSIPLSIDRNALDEALLLLEKKNGDEDTDTLTEPAEGDE
ncbi:MAG: DUF4194 domain-containing protein [Treponema sp.]|nr:DUF4194 domain-containing protein [Treponema sp.]